MKRHNLNSGLTVNASYVARLSLSGDSVFGSPSSEVYFDTNNIGKINYSFVLFIVAKTQNVSFSAELPSITIVPSNIIQFDPDLLSPIHVQCLAICQPPAEIKWIVNSSGLC